MTGSYLRLVHILAAELLLFLLPCPCPLPFPTPAYWIGIKMGLTDLSVELLESIIDYTIPKNWEYYSEGRRLLCSKPFISSRRA
jgi:hypothetical protein